MSEAADDSPPVAESDTEGACVVLFSVSFSSVVAAVVSFSLTGSVVVASVVFSVAETFVVSAVVEFVTASVVFFSVGSETDGAIVVVPTEASLLVVVACVVEGAVVEAIVVA